MDADDAGQTRAEIGAENWDQTPAKGWKIEKKLRQVGSVDKTRIMAPKDIPPEAIQKEDGCELCKAGVRNKAFVCFRMPGARACIRCVQNKLKCSFNIPEGEDDDGDDEEYDGEDGPPTIGIVAEAGPMPTRPKRGRAQISEASSSKRARRDITPISISSSDGEAGPAPRSPLFFGSSGETQQEELPPTLDEFSEPGPETSTTPSISSVDLPQMEMAPPSPPVRRDTSLATPGPLLLPSAVIPDTPALARQISEAPPLVLSPMVFAVPELLVPAPATPAPATPPPVILVEDTQTAAPHTPPPLPESTTPIGPIPGPSNRFVSMTPPMPRGWQPPSDIHTYGPAEFAAILSDLDKDIRVQRARILRERDQLAALQTERDYWEHLVHQRRHGRL